MANRSPSKAIVHLFLVGILCFSPFTDATAQVKNVWALGESDKVFKFDQSHPAKKGNIIWDGKNIHLKGLFNEVLAFQLIVEAGPAGAEGIEVAMTCPANRQTGNAIGASTLRDGPGGTIEIFSEHYLEVTRPTQPNWYYGSSAAAPGRMVGWIPDALIPGDAKAGQ